MKEKNMSIKNNKHQKFMVLSIAEAFKGIKKGQTPFGACIVRAGKIISLEHNRVWMSTDITAHAEICAIRKACIKLKTVDLSGCVIYSTCEPCPMCFSAIHWAGIREVIFGVRIKDALKIGFNELVITNSVMKRLGKSRVSITSGFMRKENLRLLQIWHSRKDRRGY